MKSQFFAAALAAVAFVGVPECAFGEETTNQLVRTESELEMPSVEASLHYRSMKIERGQVENPESIFGYEIELEWYGLFGCIETCYDMTNLNRRRGRYNEIESSLGYGRKFGDLTVAMAYGYRTCAGDEPDTQQVEFELEYETRWANPVFELECDTHDKPGALYGVLGLEREWELAEWLKLVTVGGVGFGNAYRNDADFESDKWAFREMYLGCALEIEVCPHVNLVPGIDFYDYFTEDQRRTYDKFHGFTAVASCSLEFTF